MRPNSRPPIGPSGSLCSPELFASLLLSSDLGSRMEGVCLSVVPTQTPRAVSLAALLSGLLGWQVAGGNTGSLCLHLSCVDPRVCVFCFWPQPTQQHQGRPANTVTKKQSSRNSALPSLSSFSPHHLCRIAHHPPPPSLPLFSFPLLARAAFQPLHRQTV